MSPDTRIVHLPSGRRLERGWANKSLALGHLVWIEAGVSVRDATLAEQMEARTHRRELSTPLPSYEVQGCVFEPPTADRSTAKLITRRRLLGAAIEFYHSHALEPA